MLSNEEYNLIESYHNHTLSDSNQLLFIEKILQNGGDNPFAKTLKLQNIVEQILKKHPVVQARMIVQKLGIDLLIEEGRQNLPTEPNQKQATYSLEELRQMFAPIIGIEEAVHTRSSMTEDNEKTLQSIVVLPETGIDCNDTLSFHLSESVNSALLLLVYNNQQISVLKQEIAPNELLFELDVTLSPGRYYWKLTPTDRDSRRQLGVATGVFFVNASLMPDD